MMPFIKRLPIAILFALLLTDCSKDDPIGLCQVQTDTFTEGTTSTTSYVYTEHLLTSQTTTAPGYSLALTYKYVDGLIAVANAEKNGVAGKITYNYGINAQLAMSLSIFGTDTVTTTFTFNDKGQLTRKIQAYVGAILTDSITFDYTYPDALTRNPSSIVETHGSALPVTTLYQYDNKINPFRDIFPSTRAFNNIVRIEEDGSLTTISYTYNEFGYPVSATWSSGETQSFSYKCE